MEIIGQKLTVTVTVFDGSTSNRNSASWFTLTWLTSGDAVDDPACAQLILGATPLPRTYLALRFARTLAFLLSLTRSLSLSLIHTPVFHLCYFIHIQQGDGGLWVECPRHMRGANTSF